MNVKLFVILIVLNPVLAWANQNARIPTVAELRLLPPYCKDTQIISSFYGRQQSPASYDATTATWVNAYGDGFWHVHHYCFAMTYVLRSHRMSNQRERMGLLTQSLGEFEYVLKSANQSFPLRPEIHTKKAQALVMLGRGSEATSEFQKAITSKADYPGPYGFLSDYYVEAGDKAQAIKVLEDGLTAAPTSEFLLRRYRNLGGKKTFEVPVEMKVPEPPSTLAPEKSDDDSKSVRQPEVMKVEPTPEVRGGNPYCRFCP